MSLVLYVINTMFWLHWMLNDFWIVETSSRSLRKRKQFLLLVFGKQKTWGQLIWLNKDVIFYFFFFWDTDDLRRRGCEILSEGENGGNCPHYFFPAFAMRQKRVENFQLLRSDTARNASYVKSLRRLIYRCFIPCKYLTVLRDKLK